MTTNNGNVIIHNACSKPISCDGYMAIFLTVAISLAEKQGLYYLNARYYNPEIGRFINADSYASTGQGILGNNMFAYCLNNPVRLKDSQGESATLAGGILGGVFGFVGALIAEATDEKEGVDWSNVIKCTASGAITGAAAGFIADVSIATFGAGTAALIATAGGALMAGANSVHNQLVLTDTIDPAALAVDMIFGGIGNGLATGFSSQLNPVVKGVKSGIEYAAGTLTREIYFSFDVASFVVEDFLPTAITNILPLYTGLWYSYSSN